MKFKLKILLIYFLAYIEYGFTFHNKTAVLSDMYNKYNQLTPTILNFTPANYDYFVKLLPNQKPECPGLKTVSKTYSASLKIAQELKLNNEDLMHCEVTNANFVENRKSRLFLYTKGSTSDPSSVATFSNPTNESCFSFRVKTKGTAVIYLYNELTRYKYITVNLGSNNNTQSFMADNHGTCTSCKPVSTYGILSSDDLQGFWISWNEEEVSVGKENESSSLFSSTFPYGVGSIRYIGLASPGDLSHGVWSIEEPFCPEILERPLEEHTILTKCHKIFDNKKLALSTASADIKLLKKVEALNAEFNVESASAVVTKERIQKYYYSNLDALYINDYVNLYTKCKIETCNTETLDTIESNITELRKILLEKMKEININCSSNGLADDDKCVCNEGYAGNGFYCETDSDKDGVPDEAIQECIDSPSCQKDNCPTVFNPDQQDENNDGVGDECEKKTNSLYTDNNIENMGSSEESTKQNKKTDLNCANIPLPITGDRCILNIGFHIPHNYSEHNVEIIFSQVDSEKMFKLTWEQKQYPTFILNKLNSLEDEISTNRFSYNSNLVWEFRYGNSFKSDMNYRFLIYYNKTNLHLRIDDDRENIINSQDISEFENTSGAIDKVCLTSREISWIPGPIHNCI